MEENGRMGIQRSWVFPNQSVDQNRVLQFISAVAGREAPLVKSETDPTAAQAGSHHTTNSRLEFPVSPTGTIEFSREAWLQQRNLIAKLLHTMPGSSDYSGKGLVAVKQEPPATEMLQIDHSAVINPSEIPEGAGEMVDNVGKKGVVPKKELNVKKPRTKVTLVRDPNGWPEAKSGKKNSGAIFDGIKLDLACVPVPVCSCTGVPKQCYKWGSSGWQSTCCTPTLSAYPLPMNPKKQGVRIPGRKMSHGAFKKVLEKLLSEGHSSANPVDLRTHWAKHGTNKFVAIR